MPYKYSDLHLIKNKNTIISYNLKTEKMEEVPCIYMNIKELIKYITKHNPDKMYFNKDEYEKLQIEMSNLIKEKYSDEWAGSSDNVLATYMKDIPEENFLCKGIPIIVK